MFYPKLMETGRSDSGKYVLIQASETSCAPWADPLSQQGGLGFTTMSLSAILTASVEHYPCKSINPQLDSGNTIFNHRRVSIMAEDVLVLLAPGHLQLTQACRCIYRETQRNIPQRGNQRNVIASTQNDVFFSGMRVLKTNATLSQYLWIGCQNKSNNCMHPTQYGMDCHF